MTRASILVIVIILGLVFQAAIAHTEEPRQEIGIDEKLGSLAPLDLGFVDADGDSVYLRDIVKRPTILTLVYFHCPTICKPLLGGVVELVNKTDLAPGTDYDIVTISFDDTDGPASASNIRNNFMNSVEREVGDGGWRFLTADSATIADLTDGVGFRFRRQENDFAHGTALIVLSPAGKIVRYLYGMRFMPFDLKMAVAEADKGRVAPSIARVLRYCFSYDPEGRRYVFNITRVVGASVLLFAFGWVTYLGTRGRTRKEGSKSQND